MCDGICSCCGRKIETISAPDGTPLDVCQECWTAGCSGLRLLTALDSSRWCNFLNKPSHPSKPAPGTVQSAKNKVYSPL